MSISSPHIHPLARGSAYEGDDGALNRAIDLARLALGQRMFAVAIDDGRFWDRIDALNQAISCAITRPHFETLCAERDRLFVGLADAALADDAPLPGADTEYARVRELLASK